MLARWSGWGAVPKVFDPDAVEFADERAELQALLSESDYTAARRNVLNAHYTDASYVQPVWQALHRLGLTSGHVLEPGCGVGNFVGFAPDGVQLTGIELDPTTARMAALVYPDHRIYAGSFAEVHGSDEAFDAAIGNVPFARARLHDPGYNDAHYPMHTHFLLKSLRMTRPGGLVGVWISRYMLDGHDEAARSELADLADLVTAVRTPVGAHAEAAGTDVVTDFVLLRRRADGEQPDTSTPWRRVRPLSETSASTAETENELEQVAVNEYFLAHPDHVLGSLDARIGRFGPELTVHAHPGVDLGASLQRVLDGDVDRALQRGWGMDPSQHTQSAPELALGRDLDQRFQGALAAHEDGTFTQWLGGRWQPHEPPKTQARELRELIGLRETVQALLEAENATGEDTADIDELRGDLNQRYDAYVARYGPINRFSWRAQSKPGWSAFTAWCRERDYATLPADGEVVLQYLQHLVDAGCEQDLVQRHFEAITKRHTARENPLTAEVTSRAQGLIAACRDTPAPDLDLEALGLTSYTRKTPPQGGFGTDPFSSLVRALEIFDPTSQQADKAGVFHRRVVQPVATPTRAGSPVDAVSISLTTYAELRLDYVADLLNLDGPEAAREVLTSGEKPLAFVEPDTDTVVVRNDYLSDNVRAKLAAAEEAATTNPAWSGNVEALRAVVPADLGPDEIEVQLGSWIDASYVQQFLRELLDDATQVAHHDRFWSVQGGNPRSSAARDTWGTRERSAQQLVEALLTGRQIRVTYKNDDGTTHTDAEATEDAKNKAREISERFRDWVWEDTTRADDIVVAYNERFNAHVPRSYDDIELTTPGLANHIHLRAHQKAAIAAMIFQPSFGLWHEVGAGKTLEMIVGAMERKRLGLVEKQVVNIPNHMLEQFEREWLQAYPQAKLLVASSEELSGSRRRDFIARAMTDSYDAVILTEGAFKALPVSPEAEERFIAAEADAITNALEEARATDAHERTVKDLEERQLEAEEAAKGKLAKLHRDPGVSWEDVGFDSIIVDESQRFKNSRRFSGLPDMGHPGADRAVDLDMKVGLLVEQYGHSRYTSATATPFTNSLAEIYTELRRLGADVDDLDTWARTWGELMSTQEMTPGGGFKEMTRLRKLINVPELALWLRLHADIRTAEHLQLPVPDIAGGGPQAIAVPPSSELVQFNAELARRYGDIKPRPEKGDDNHLSLIGLGTQAALDMRLVDREPDEPQKVDLLAESIAERYQQNKDNVYLAADGSKHPTRGALQVVFCSTSTPDPNRWNFYDELRTQLTARGVPERLVRFVHEAPTDQKRAELFAAARSGDVAVLIGSSEKMGTGTNVQNRAIGLYQVSPPWRADTVHQEAGRVVRQGNQNSEVFVERWTTEQSLEAKKWQVVLQKWEAFRPLMTGEIDRRIIEMPDEDTDHYSELMAMASGDDRVRRKAALESEVNRLTRLRKAWARQQTNYQVTVSRAAERVPTLSAHVEQIDAAIAVRTDTSGEQFAMTLQGQRHTERMKAAAHLSQVVGNAVANASPEDTTKLALGSLGGLRVQAEIRRWHSRTVALQLADIPGEIPLHHRDVPSAHHGVITRLENWVAGLETQQTKITDQLTTLQTEADKARPLIGKPFAHQPELDEATAQLTQLNRELSETSQPDTDTAGPVTVTSPDELITAYQARIQNTEVPEALRTRMRQVLLHADPRASEESFDQPDPQRLLVDPTSGMAAVATTEGQPWQVFAAGSALSIPLSGITTGTNVQSVDPHSREQAQAFLSAATGLRDADGHPPPLHSPEFTPETARDWRDHQGRTLPAAMRAVLLPAYLDALGLTEAAEQVRTQFPSEQVEAVSTETRRDSVPPRQGSPVTGPATVASPGMFAVTTPEELITAYQARLHNESEPEHHRRNMHAILAKADPHEFVEAFDQPDPDRLLVDGTTGLAAVAPTNLPWSIFAIGTAQEIPLAGNLDQQDLPHSRDRAQAALDALTQLRDITGAPPPMHDPSFTPRAMLDWRDEHNRTLVEAINAASLPAYLAAIGDSTAQPGLSTHESTTSPQPTSMPASPADPLPDSGDSTRSTDSTPEAAGEIIGVHIGADGSPRRFEVPTAATEAAPENAAASASQALPQSEHALWEPVSSMLSHHQVDTSADDLAALLHALDQLAEQPKIQQAARVNTVDQYGDVLPDRITDLFVDAVDTAESGVSAPFAAAFLNSSLLREQLTRLFQHHSHALINGQPAPDADAHIPATAEEANPVPSDASDTAQQQGQKAAAQPDTVLEAIRETCANAGVTEPQRVAVAIGVLQDAASTVGFREGSPITLSQFQSQLNRLLVATAPAGHNQSAKNLAATLLDLLPTGEEALRAFAEYQPTAGVSEDEHRTSESAAESPLPHDLDSMATWVTAQQPQMRDAVRTWIDPSTLRPDRANAYSTIGPQHSRRGAQVWQRLAAAWPGVPQRQRGRFNAEAAAEGIQRWRDGDPSFAPNVLGQTGTLTGIDTQYRRGESVTYSGTITALTPVTLGKGSDRHPGYRLRVEPDAARYSPHLEVDAQQCQFTPADSAAAPETPTPTPATAPSEQAEAGADEADSAPDSETESGEQTAPAAVPETSSAPENRDADGSAASGAFSVWPADSPQSGVMDTMRALADEHELQHTVIEVAGVRYVTLSEPGAEAMPLVSYSGGEDVTFTRGDRTVSLQYLATNVALYRDAVRPGVFTLDTDVPQWSQRVAQLVAHTQNGPHFHRAVRDDLNTAIRMAGQGRGQEAHRWLSQAEQAAPPLVMMPHRAAQVQQALAQVAENATPTVETVAERVTTDSGAAVTEREKHLVAEQAATQPSTAPETASPQESSQETTAPDTRPETTQQGNSPSPANESAEEPQRTGAEAGSSSPAPVSEHESASTVGGGADQGASATHTPPATQQTALGEQVDGQPVGVWSRRISIEDSGTTVTVSGTSYDDPSSLRQALKDHGFRWRKQRQVWQRRGPVAERERAVEAVRAVLADLDAQETKEDQAAPFRAELSGSAEPTSQGQSSAAGQPDFARGAAHRDGVLVLPRRSFDSRYLTEAVPGDTPVAYRLLTQPSAPSASAQDPESESGAATGRQAAMELLQAARDDLGERSPQARDAVDRFAADLADTAAAEQETDSAQSLAQEPQHPVTQTVPGEVELTLLDEHTAEFPDALRVWAGTHPTPRPGAVDLGVTLQQHTEDPDSTGSEATWRYGLHWLDGQKNRSDTGQYVPLRRFSTAEQALQAAGQHLQQWDGLSNGDFGPEHEDRIDAQITASLAESEQADPAPSWPPEYNPDVAQQWAEFYRAVAIESASNPNWRFGRFPAWTIPPAELPLLLTDMATTDPADSTWSSRLSAYGVEITVEHAEQPDTDRWVVARARRHTQRFAIPAGATGAEIQQVIEHALADPIRRSSWAQRQATPPSEEPAATGEDTEQSEVAATEHPALPDEAEAAAGEDSATQLSLLPEPEPAPAPPERWPLFTPTPGVQPAPAEHRAHAGDLLALHEDELTVRWDTLVELAEQRGFTVQRTGNRIRFPEPGVLDVLHGLNTRHAVAELEMMLAWQQAGTDTPEISQVPRALREGTLPPLQLPADAAADGLPSLQDPTATVEWVVERLDYTWQPGTPRSITDRLSLHKVLQQGLARTGWEVFLHHQARIVVDENAGQLTVPARHVPGDDGDVLIVELTEAFVHRLAQRRTNLTTTAAASIQPAETTTTLEAEHNTERALPPSETTSDAEESDTQQPAPEPSPEPGPPPLEDQVEAATAPSEESVPESAAESQQSQDQHAREVAVTSPAPEPQSTPSEVDSGTVVWPTPDTGEPELDRLAQVNAAAAAYFAAQLDRSTAAQNYLVDRLGSQQAVEVVRERLLVGYGPRDWTGLIEHVRQAGFTDDDMVNAGVATRSERTNDLITAFYDRIVFGIRDEHGRLAGFTGRDLSGKAQAKYRNTRQTDLYRKTGLLLGSAEQQQHLARAKWVVLCEGPLDAAAITATTAETGRIDLVAVAACGTAITDEHLQLLDTVMDPQATLVIAADNDQSQAGRRKGLATVERALVTMSRPVVYAEPPESGHDPASWAAQQGSPSLQLYTSDAQPGLMALVTDLTAGRKAGESSVEQAIYAAEDCVELLARFDLTGPRGHELGPPIAEAARTLYDPSRIMEILEHRQSGLTAAEAIRVEPASENTDEFEALADLEETPDPVAEEPASSAATEEADARPPQQSLQQTTDPPATDSGTETVSDSRSGDELLAAVSPDALRQYLASTGWSDTGTTVADRAAVFTHVVHGEPYDVLVPTNPQRGDYPRRVAALLEHLEDVEADTGRTRADILADLTIGAGQPAAEAAVNSSQHAADSGPNPAVGSTSDSAPTEPAAEDLAGDVSVPTGEPREKVDQDDQAVPSHPSSDTRQIVLHYSREHGLLLYGTQRGDQIGNHLQFARTHGNAVGKWKWDAHYTAPDGTQGAWHGEHEHTQPLATDRTVRTMQQAAVALQNTGLPIVLDVADTEATDDAVYQLGIHPAQDATTTDSGTHSPGSYPWSDSQHHQWPDSHRYGYLSDTRDALVEIADIDQQWVMRARARLDGHTLDVRIAFDTHERAADIAERLSTSPGMLPRFARDTVTTGLAEAHVDGRPLPKVSTWQALDEQLSQPAPNTAGLSRQAQNRPAPGLMSPRSNSLAPPAKPPAPAMPRDHTSLQPR